MVYKFIVVNHCDLTPVAEVVEAETFVKAAAKAFPNHTVLAAHHDEPSDFSIRRVIETDYGKQYISRSFNIEGARPVYSKIE